MRWKIIAIIDWSLTHIVFIQVQSFTSSDQLIPSTLLFPSIINYYCCQYTSSASHISGVSDQESCRLRLLSILAPVKLNCCDPIVHCSYKRLCTCRNDIVKAWASTSQQIQQRISIARIHRLQYIFTHFWIIWFYVVTIRLPYRRDDSRWGIPHTQFQYDSPSVSRIE